MNRLRAQLNWRFLEASLALTNITNTNWREAQFAENTCVNQAAGFDFTRPYNTNQPWPASGNRPAQNFFSDGIEGVSFTPGNPFGVRGELQISF